MSRYTNTSSVSTRILELVHIFALIPLESCQVIDCLICDEACIVQEAVERGVEHARDEEFGAARQCYKQALEIFPENVDALVALGAAHANQKNFKEALSCFGKALGGCPCDAPSIHHSFCPSFNGRTFALQVYGHKTRMHLNTRKQWSSVCRPLPNLPLLLMAVNLANLQLSMQLLSKTQEVRTSLLLNMQLAIHEEGKQEQHFAST